MEDFKKILIIKTAAIGVLAIISVVGALFFKLLGSQLFGMSDEAKSNSALLCFIVFLVAILGFGLHFITLKNEKELRRTYIKQTDERLLQIKAKSSNLTLNIIIGALYACIIYTNTIYNNTVGTLLLQLLVAILILRGLVSYIYTKMM